MALGDRAEIHNVAPKLFLTITEPPLLQASLTNRNFELLLTSRIGSASNIEVSANFATWTLLGTVTNTSRSVPVFDPDTARHRSRFYRATLK
jgi:hypothetical protein